MVHEIKLEANNFYLVKNWIKCFEYRKNDRGYKVGHTLNRLNSDNLQLEKDKITRELLREGFIECLADGLTTEKGWQKGECNLKRDYKKD